jgi:ABC-2 type transport system permease protein
VIAAASREARVVVALGRRSLSLQFRRAQLLMPTFVLPLLLLAVISSGTSAGRNLESFPDVSSYLGFVVAGTLLQGALLSGLTTGIAIASDIEGGFFDRLLAAPVRRSSLVFGRLAGTLGLAVIQMTWFLLVALLFGASYPGGVLGAAGAAALAVITSVAIGGVACAIAIRTGSMSLMQSIFPLVFVFLFTAPAFFPRDLLTPTLHTLSAYNPLTYVVEGARGLLQDDTTLGNPLLGLAAALGLAAFATGLAVLALRDRARRS